MVEDAAVDHEHEGLAELEDIGFGPAEGEDESVNFGLLSLLHEVIFHSLLYILLL